MSAGRVRRLLATAALALIAACSAGPASLARQQCELLEIAMDEGEFAEAWYLEAGQVLKACGVTGAEVRAEHKACYARRFNDNSVVCE